MTAISALELDATLEQLQQSGLVYIQKLPQPAALFCESIQNRLTHSMLLADLSSTNRVKQQLAQLLNCQESADAILQAGTSLKQPLVLLIHCDSVDLSAMEYLLELSVVGDAGCAQVRLLVLETPILKQLWQTRAGSELSQRFRVRPSRSPLVASPDMVNVAVAVLLLAGATLGYMVGWSDWASQRPGADNREVDASNTTEEIVPQVQMTAADKRQVRKAVERWRKAWEQQDWPAYEDCYVSYYLPLGNDLSHEQWVRWRRARLERPVWIEVVITDVKLEPLDHYQMRVTFQQAYAAPGYSDTALKELYLVRLAEGWKINAERSLKTLSLTSGSANKKGA